ncbi:LysR family transcriptional regulator [Dactylosporangium roseum]|uniref:LysR family transcriptional regulator n=1 Tax=Dactylosporangium roseum TaxID=47989 RepID=A0ABY5YXR3_9ACTN|nr:LysR family transcriptional regulator [Dactylosporangium roseum]UWZ34322.1 LysR family transcriptional regulator [Dactylosporangium roseum]
MGIDVRHLRAICVIAEAGSVTAAAAQLNLSQPALTAQLHRIEELLGGVLFVRSRTGVEPTELGRRVLSRARVVLNEVDAFVDDFREAHRASGFVRLGAVHLACAASLVDRVKEAFRDTEVALRIEPSSRLLVDAVTHGQLDAALVGIMEGFEIPFGSMLASRTLIPRYPIFIALSASHRLAQQDSVDLADLSGERWVSPPGPDDGSLTSLRRACRAAGFEPDIRYDAPSGAGQPLVQSGNGVRLVDPTWPQPPGTVVLPLHGEPQIARLVVIWRRDAFSQVESELLYRGVTNAFLDHVPNNPAFERWWHANPQAHPIVQ